jgi:hypothetical protein
MERVMSIEVNPAHDPAAFARHVRAMSDADLELLMCGERRATILEGIFRRMPDVFRADRAGALDAVVHWHIPGRADNGEDVYELRIAGGRCVVADRPDSTPRLTLRLDAVNFVKMATGNANARMLFLRGRLKARGDLGLTNKFPSLFDIPKAG